MDPAKRKQEEIQIRKLTEFMNSTPANSVCCDCGTKGPRWASTNLGALLCIRCGGIHRALGTHITKIKSLSLDIWPVELLETFLNLGGNEAVNNHFMPRPELVPPPPTNDDLRMEQWIRDKYERKKFMSPGAAGRGSTEERARDPIQQRTAYGGQTQRSAPSPAPTDLKDKYRTHLSKLMAMGFQDEALNLKLLHKFSGSVNETVDYLLANSSNGRSTGPAGTFDEHRTAELRAPPQSSRSRNHASAAAAPALPAAPKVETVDDIFGAFMSSSGPSDVPAPVPQPAAPAAPAAPPVDARKAQILALYNTPAPRAPTMQQQPAGGYGFDQPRHQQGNPFAAGWSTQPMPQQQNFMDQQPQTYTGQQPENWQTGGMAPMQPQGQFNSWQPPQQQQQADPFAAFGNITTSANPNANGHSNNTNNNPFF